MSGHGAWLVAGAAATLLFACQGDRSVIRASANHSGSVACKSGRPAGSERNTKPRSPAEPRWARPPTPPRTRLLRTNRCTARLRCYPALRHDPGALTSTVRRADPAAQHTMKIEEVQSTTKTSRVRRAHLSHTRHHLPSLPALHHTSAIAIPVPRDKPLPPLTKHCRRRSHRTATSRGSGSTTMAPPRRSPPGWLARCRRARPPASRWT